MSSKNHKFAQPNSSSQADDHIVRDEDYNNLVGLLNILSYQLALSLDEGQKDYQKVAQYCLAEVSSDTNNNNAEVVRALQNFDRSSQRVTHVIESLSSLAVNLLDERWRSIDVDLEDELKKTHSFYDAGQTQEMSDLIARVCELNEQLQSVVITNIEGNSNSQGENKDDVEFF